MHQCLLATKAPAIPVKRLAHMRGFPTLVGVTKWAAHVSLTWLLILLLSWQ